eukprot:CAMPEP_0172767718 /NCGR_PEP_ID=MMETSP1074-20121228/183397_1 /TAXON_ID=2916 /ORGANISM="Ceratium fusus, Strain PA161109" /LENGTH=74 /DNA_ID=CAMNT_0013603003 /DNA_START=36 /DNA_END=257 /DNA_ORIENTATION=-
MKGLESDATSKRKKPVPLLAVFSDACMRFLSSSMPVARIASLSSKGLAPATDHDLRQPTDVAELLWMVLAVHAV